MTWQLQDQPPKQGELFPDAKAFPACNNPRLTVLSYGAGQDSTALLYLLGLDPEFRSLFAPQRLVVVFSDTGAEHDETYTQALPDARAFCEEQDIPFFWLEPGSGFHSSAWPSLLGQYERNSTCGSRGFPRTCTDNLKIKPIYRWLESYLETELGISGGRKTGFYRYAAEHGQLRMLIGLSAEETGRCAGNSDSRPLWMRRCIEIRYPLQDVGFTRQDAQQVIRDLGYRVPAPSSCWCCPFLTLRDLLWKHRARRHEYDELVLIEERKLARWKRLGDHNYGVFGRKTIPQALAEAEAAFGHMTDSELTQARMRDGHAVASRY